MREKCCYSQDLYIAVKHRFNNLPHVPSKMVVPYLQNAILFFTW